MSTFRFSDVLIFETIPTTEGHLSCKTFLHLNLHVSGVLLGLGESQFLGVVLALIVGLCNCQWTEGGVTQLTIVVLCGQDDPGCPFIQRLRERDKAVLCQCGERRHKQWQREERNFFSASGRIRIVLYLFQLLKDSKHKTWDQSWSPANTFWDLYFSSSSGLASHYLLL